ncbi:hypothetical protein BV25DRAFT_1992028 [Artomyces pyxidatus]|uniref:Uncharacterized protein n=1 Tax=Artomyces pyxidatus TaxID=48021 RepID=A0ACB8T0J6_9AGAM|nr:hypothetical protein BV25DRAFT_1992028 [Artomyces pyxidatus]
MAFVQSAVSARSVTLVITELLMKLMLILAQRCRTLSALARPAVHTPTSMHHQSACFRSHSRAVVADQHHSH